MSAAVPQEADGARDARQSAPESAASTTHEASTYEEVNDRLKQIVSAIDDDMPLDHALDLLEEAVGLGMKASELIERDVEAADGAKDEDAEAPQSSDTVSGAGDAEDAGADAAASASDTGKAV